jgi:hypothetical protein
MEAYKIIQTLNKSSMQYFKLNLKKLQRDRKIDVSTNVSDIGMELHSDWHT